MGGEVRVGVLGAGRWGRNLVRTFDELNALAAIADPSEAIREEMAAGFPDAKILLGAEELFASDVDAIAIATPAATHADLAIAAIEAGKDVFVEKPFALTVADAERVVAAGEAADRIVMVGHLLLYQSAILFIRDYLASGAIGEVAFLNQDRLNLGTVRTAENALWSLGVHDVAAMLFLTGEEPTTVDTWGQRVLQPAIEDDMHLHMLFPSQTEAHIHACWLWPEQRRRLTVVGTAAMITYDEVRPRGPALPSSRETRPTGGGRRKRGAPHWRSARPLAAEAEQFLVSVRERSSPQSDGASALPVVRVLEMSASN